MIFLPMMINSVHTKGEGVLMSIAIHLILRDETWEALVERLASLSEGSHQASSLLLTKKNQLPKKLLKIPQLLLLQKVISVQFKHAHGIKPK